VRFFESAHCCATIGRFFPLPRQVGPNHNVKVSFTAAMSGKLAVFFETRSLQFCIPHGHTPEIHTVLWDIQPCGVVEGYWHLPETYRLHLHSRSLSQASNQQEASNNGCLLDLLYNPKDGGNIFLRNVTKLLPDHTAIHPKRQHTS
jgi:hypothetical protein